MYTIRIMMGNFRGVFEGDEQIAMFKHKEHAEWFVECITERKQDD